MKCEPYNITQTVKLKTGRVRRKRNRLRKRGLHHVMEGADEGTGGGGGGKGEGGVGRVEEW